MKFGSELKALDRSTKIVPLAAIAVTAIFGFALGALPSLAKPKAVASPVAVVPSPVITPSPVATPLDPARSGANLSSTIPSDKRIPILMYHYIRDYHSKKDKVGNNLSVGPTVFAKQLQTLKDMGFTAITFNDLTDPVNLPEKPVILTFDDGYSDAYTAALPELQKQGMTGVFYLVSGLLNQGGYLNNEQVKALDAAGMQIGAHGVEHKDLSKMTSAGQRHQLTESKVVLEQIIGKPVRDFCYPSGKLNETTLALAKEIGYRSATTVKDGIVPGGYWPVKPFELPRIRMSEGTDLARELRSIQ